MAVYRSDQAQLTFAAEGVPGGVIETAGSATADGTTSTTALNGAVVKGTRTITVDAISNGAVAVGDIYRIEATGGAVQSELVKVEFLESSLIWWLDAPLAFSHDNDVALTRVTSVTSVASDQFITQIPGIYETIDTPDPEMAIEPRYFLGTQSKRNFFAAYKGQQTYTGSVSGIIPINAAPFRFPIGRMVDVPSSSQVFTSAVTLSLAAAKGDVQISAVTASSATTLQVGEYIYMWDDAAAPSAVTPTAKNEIARVLAASVVATSGHTVVKLTTPLRFAHSAGDKIYSVGNVGVAGLAAGGYIAHHILEDYELDSMTWHVHMRDSSETAANDFDRRYYGGKVGATTITAEEGGMLTMGWDGVNFLGMKHNQTQGVDPDGSTARDLPFYNLMQSITSTAVDFPTTEPYYFSQGQVKIFGETIARIRSFSLSISNNEEPRYYVSRQFGRHRGPTEIREQRREYGLAVTLALPDSGASNTARKTLWSELLLEGDYGEGMRGFNIELRFDRGANDSLVIRIPDDYDGSANDAGAALGGNQQGAFIRTAAHSITTDNPFQVEADVFFRNLKMIITDTKGDYV